MLKHLFDSTQSNHFCCFVFHSCCLVAGVPKQASDLGVGAVAAHGPRHGHREHPALRWLQPTEHYTGRESHMHKNIHTFSLSYMKLTYFSLNEV